jgi:hypothetical protein
MNLMVIVDENNTIIFKQSFGESKNPLPYLLAYAVLDSSENQTYENFFAEQRVLNSGHRIVLVSHSTEKVPQTFISRVTKALISEIMDPLVDDSAFLSDSFCRAVSEIFNQTISKTTFSL